MFPKFGAAFKDTLLPLSLGLLLLVSGCRRYHYDVIAPQQGLPAEDAGNDSDAAPSSEDAG